MENCYSLVEYLGLSDDLLPTNIESGENLTCAAHELLLRKTEKSQFMMQLANEVIGPQICETRDEELFKNNHWMFIGIVKGDVVPLDNLSYGRKLLATIGTPDVHTARGRGL